MAGMDMDGGWRGALAALLLASVSVGAQAACSVSQAEIPVRIIDHRPVATLKLNGVEMPMLLDSGAFFSMLNPSTAAELNLSTRRLPDGLIVRGYTGNVEARQTKVAKVGLLGSELHNVEFIVGGNEMSAGMRGIIGRNFLSAGDTEFDLAHGSVRLSFPNDDCRKSDLAYWAGNAPVVIVPMEYSLNPKDSEIRVVVQVNGKRAVALLDTGATYTTMTRKFARRAGIEEGDMKVVGRATGVGQGAVSVWSARMATFEFGGEKISNNAILVSDVDYADEDMLLGLDYFLSHHVYVSRLQQQVYVTWNGGPVFALARDGKGEYDAKYAAAPQEVKPDDADGLARRSAAELAAGDLPHALADIDKACELAPTVAENFHLRARVRLAMHEPRPALADLDEAVRLDAALAQARFLRAQVRRSAGDRPGAQADLAILDTALPPGFPLRADMARMYANFNQTDQALKQFDLWIASHGSDVRMASVLNDRCWMRTRMNLDVPKALEDCKEAVDLDGDESAFRDSLGWTYLRIGDAQKAKAAFDGAIKLQSRPLSLYGRGLAERRLNDTAGGDRDLAAARALTPAIDEEVRRAGFEAAERPAASGS